jgi:hypothetical protein
VSEPAEKSGLEAPCGTFGFNLEQWGGGRHLAKMYGRSRRNLIPITASPLKQQEDTDND